MTELQRRKMLAAARRKKYDQRTKDGILRVELYVTQAMADRMVRASHLPESDVDDSKRIAAALARIIDSL